MVRVLLVAPALTAALLTAGCQTTPPVQAPPVRTAAPASEPRQLAIGPDVGNVAPQVAGEDTNGQPMSLGDYKGQVVVLHFWGNWCKPCKDLIPYERSLVAKMEGRPFALLGVNCDKEPDTIQQVGYRNDITWRNWWNGGIQGPLTNTFKIRQFPTAVVVDANGVVRYHGQPGPGLEPALERLVREAETRKNG